MEWRIHLRKIRECPKELIELFDEQDGYVPSPQERYNLIRKYGCSNLHDWTRNNWGTTGGIFYSTSKYAQLEDNKLIFDSRWCPPREAISLMSKQFPNIVFRLDWVSYEYGVEEHTVYKNGEYIEKESHEMPEPEIEEENSSMTVVVDAKAVEHIREVIGLLGSSYSEIIESGDKGSNRSGKIKMTANYDTLKCVETDIDLYNEGFNRARAFPGEKPPYVVKCDEKCDGTRPIPY